MLQRLGGLSAGRTLLWEQAREYFWNAPLFGHGMGSSYRAGGVVFDVYGNAFHGMNNG